MAGASEIAAGRAAIFITVRDNVAKGLAGVQQQITRTLNGLTRMGTAIGAVGAAASAPFVRSAQIFAQFGDEVNAVALRTNISARSISELAFAAEQSDTSLAELEKGFRRLSVTIQAAKDGSKSAKDLFAAIGVDFQKLSQLSPDAQFEKIADAISAIEDPTERVARQIDLFGKSGAQLGPLLNLGAAGIQKLRTQAQSLGVTLSDDQAQSAADLADAWGRVTDTLRGLQTSIGAAIAPTITAVADSFAGAAAGAIQFVRQNQPLVQSLALAAAAAVALGGTLVGLSASAAALLGTLALVASTATLIGGVIAAVTSPLGILAAAVAAATAAWLKFTESGRAASDIVSGAFSEVTQSVSDGVATMVGLLQSGDLAGAAATAWDSIKLIVLQSVNSIIQLFPGLFAAIQQTWSAIVDTAVAAWSGISAFVQNTWATVTDFLAGAFDVIGANWGTITSGMFESWADFTAGLRDAWIRAGTFVLSGAIAIANGVISAFRAVASFLDEVFGSFGDSVFEVIDSTLANAQASLAEFQANAQQGGRDRLEASERKRQSDLARQSEISDSRQRQLQDEIDRLQKQIAGRRLQLPELGSADSKGGKSPGTGAAQLLGEDMAALERSTEELRVRTQGAFSAQAAQIVGANVRDRGSDQRKKMIEHLAEISRSVRARERRVAV